MSVLGLSVARHELRAAMVNARGLVVWAATVEYGEPAELLGAIGRLAADAPRPLRRVRVVLERSVIQLRTVQPVPPLNHEAARQYASLEISRLFRKNGVPMVTDARTLRIGARDRVLWAAASAEPLVAAVVQGCEQAGLMLDALGPAAEVLPRAVDQVPPDGELVFPNGSTFEVLSVSDGTVWRSRLISGSGRSSPPWAPGLQELGERAGPLAAAYAAALGRPTLELLPRETVAARRSRTIKRLRSVALIGMLCWIAAGAAHVVRLTAAATQSQRELRELAPRLERAVALQRDLHAARAALSTVHDAERNRSRSLMLLGDLTSVLGDSVFLAALQFQPDSSLRLAGYAPQAARALARLERATWLLEPRFEGPLTRERVGPDGQEYDRFAIFARMKQAP